MKCYIYKNRESTITDLNNKSFIEITKYNISRHLLTLQKANFENIAKCYLFDDLSVINNRYNLLFFILKYFNELQITLKEIDLYFITLDEKVEKLITNYFSEAIIINLESKNLITNQINYIFLKSNIENLSLSQTISDIITNILNDTTFINPKIVVYISNPKLFYKIKNILIKTFENIDDIISLGIDILDKSFKQIYFLTHCPKFNYRLSKITHIIDSLLIKNSIFDPYSETNIEIDIPISSTKILAHQQININGDLPKFYYVLAPEKIFNNLPTIYEHSIIKNSQDNTTNILFLLSCNPSLVSSQILKLGKIDLMIPIIDRLYIYAFNNLIKFKFMNSDYQLKDYGNLASKYSLLVDDIRYISMLFLGNEKFSKRIYNLFLIKMFYFRKKNQYKYSWCDIDNLVEILDNLKEDSKKNAIEYYFDLIDCGKNIFKTMDNYIEVNEFNDFLKSLSFFPKTMNEKTKEPIDNFSYDLILKTTIKKNKTGRIKRYICFAIKDDKILF